MGRCRFCKRVTLATKGKTHNLFIAVRESQGIVDNGVLYMEYFNWTHNLVSLWRNQSKILVAAEATY